MSTLDRDEFTAGYLIEADEHVRSTVSNLLAVDQALRTDAPQHRYVRELFRALHTLKGLSAMVGIDPVVDIAHEMEAILRDADTGIAKLTPQAVELLLQGVRAIEVRIELFAKRQAITVAPRGLLAALTELQVHVKKSAPPAALIKLELEPELVSKLLPLELEHLSQSVASGKRCLRVFFHPTPELSAQGLTITSVRSQLAEIAEIVKVIPTSVPKTAATPAGLAFALLLISAASDDELARAACTQPSMIAVITRKPGTEPEAEAALAPLPTLYDDEPGELVKGNRSFIRVEIERLDDALEKLSALVVTRFKLTHALTKLRDQGVDVRELAGILSENQRQLRDLRRAITRARMVSVAELLERVPLIVRGMRSSSGKQVKLVMNAGNAELDKSVAERAFPAIVHLVRNAVDHAIESAPERQKLGKPSEGTITVECFAHSDTQLEIHVSDDGRGIDPVALGRRAGRETPLDARGMLELITLPGLSTLDVATNTSGRGMGMDIVRRIAVDMLGGDLTLKTQLGQGTTFTMRLPLSISILESFSFVCAQQAFAVPVSIVDKIIDLASEQIIETPAPQSSAETRTTLRLLDHGGEAIPLFGLASLLQLAGTHSTRGKALIIRPHGQPFAFAIDRVLGQQEIVVRPVDDPLVKVPGIAGTTDLGDGLPTLVLDLVGLSVLASRVASAGVAA